MAGLLAAGLLPLTMTSPLLAQMHGGGAPAGGGATSNMNNRENGISPDGMQPNGLNAPENNTQMIEHNTFGNLRRNFDVETDLSKMALKNSTNDDLKKFAQQVIADNHKLSNQLIVPNANGEMMDSETVPAPTQKAKKQMKKMTGAPFDQMYLVQMDAYVKNDQETAKSAASMTSAPKVSEVGMRVQTMADQREKQIADLTKGAGFKIQ
jgi:predicted outer membrane protein